MARKKKEKPYGQGKTVKEIITGVSRSIGRMKEATLRQAVTRLSSAMNKRLDRAEKSGLETPATREAKESGGRFSAKGKGLEGLKAEFIRIKNFFQNPTSTKKGWEKVQKDATKEAVRRGIFRTPEEPAPTPPSPPEYANGWAPPEGWTWNEDARSWEHPDHGSGWIPYEGEGGGLLDPITNELVGNTARSYHDYDATADDRVFGGTTETGQIWMMVDSISKMDPRFSRQLSYNNPLEDPRMSLFNAIDDAWVENPGMTFEEARDLVSSRLDEIYDAATAHLFEAHDMSFGTYYSDEDDW